MIPFHSVFPEIALSETRSVILEDTGAPSDSASRQYMTASILRLPPRWR